MHFFFFHCCAPLIRLWRHIPLFFYRALLYLLHVYHPSDAPAGVIHRLSGDGE